MVTGGGRIIRRSSHDTVSIYRTGNKESGATVVVRASMTPVRKESPGMVQMVFPEAADGGPFL